MLIVSSVHVHALQYSGMPLRTHHITQPNSAEHPMETQHKITAAVLAADNNTSGQQQPEAGCSCNLEGSEPCKQKLCCQKGLKGNNQMSPLPPDPAE